MTFGVAPSGITGTHPAVQGFDPACRRQPRCVALFCFALGDGAKQKARESLGDPYAWLGDYADDTVNSAATDGDTVRHYL